MREFVRCRESEIEKGKRSFLIKKTKSLAVKYFKKKTIKKNRILIAVNKDSAMTLFTYVNDSNKEFNMATRKSRRRPTTRKAYPRKPARRRSVRGGRPWSREEIAFMRKYYRNNETSWVARQLGRTVYSVRYKASDLNIRKANPSVWRGNTGTTKPTRRTTRRRYSNRKVQTRWASPQRRTGRRTTRRRTIRRRK
jgi:hypothetical protein